MIQFSIHSRIQSTFQSISALVELSGPEGGQRGDFMIQQESSEQWIMVDEPQEVYSAEKLAGEVREALHKPGNICVSLQGAERIHTAVLQVLIAAQRSCITTKRAFSISDAARDMQAVLQMADLNFIDAI